MADKAVKQSEETVNAPEFDPREPRSIYDIITDLSKPFPSMEKKRKQGGKDITFISWHNATRILDKYANGWTYEIRNIQEIAKKVIITCRITILAQEGYVFREATGQEDENVESWGDSTSNAESMALRRAAAKFGLGRYLYNGTDSGSQSYNRPPSNQQSRSPSNQQTSGGGSGGNGGGKLASAAQIKFISDLCLQKKKSEIDVCLQFSGDKVEVFDQLTIQQAKAAIEWAQAQ